MCSRQNRSEPGSPRLSSSSGGGVGLRCRGGGKPIVIVVIRRGGGSGHVAVAAGLSRHPVAGVAPIVEVLRRSLSCRGDAQGGSHEKAAHSGTIGCRYPNVLRTACRQIRGIPYQLVDQPHAQAADPQPAHPDWGDAPRPRCRYRTAALNLDSGAKTNFARATRSLSGSPKSWLSRNSRLGSLSRERASSNYENTDRCNRARLSRKGIKFVNIFGQIYQHLGRYSNRNRFCR